MHIEVKNKSWTQAQSFSDALGTHINPPVKISVVGSGGKTSTIMRLAEEQKALNRKVLVLTTTHMFTPQKYGVFSGLKRDVYNALEKDKIAIVGKLTDDGKIAFQGDTLYREFSAMADVVLIEADGSKQKPLKFPNEFEPVIPADTDVILVLSGLSSIGHLGKNICHRWILAKNALDINDDEALIKPAHLLTLLEKGYLIPLRERFPDVPLITVFNQADDGELLKIGRELTDKLKADIGIVSSLNGENNIRGLLL